MKTILKGIAAMFMLAVLALASIIVATIIFAPPKTAPAAEVHAVTPQATRPVKLDEPTPSVVPEAPLSNQTQDKTLSLPEPEAANTPADTLAESKIEEHPDTPPSLTPDPMAGPVIPEGYEFAHVPGEQMTARNTMNVNVVGRMIGAIVCQDADSINLLLNEYASYYSWTHMTEAQRDQQQWMHGGRGSKPDPSALGCVVLPEGVPMVVTQRVGGYYVVVIRFRGVEFKGVTRMN